MRKYRGAVLRTLRRVIPVYVLLCLGAFAFPPDLGLALVLRITLLTITGFPVGVWLDYRWMEKES